MAKKIFFNIFKGWKFRSCKIQSEMHKAVAIQALIFDVLPVTSFLFSGEIGPRRILWRKNEIPSYLVLLT